MARKTIITSKSITTTSPTKAIAKVKKIVAKNLTPTKRRALTAKKTDAAK